VGRLPKCKVDRLAEMLKQGYTLKEIAKEVHCSESTVSRIKKYAETKPMTIESVASLLSIESIKAQYRTLEMLDVQPGCDKESAELLVRELGKDLTQQLMQIDTDLARKILKETRFYEYQIEPILVSRKDEERILRQEWIDLLRKYWPEKLAELIR